ncbi:protein H339R, partial [Elysia marginata]
MSKRGKIKSKTVQSTINNKDIMELFRGAIGAGEGADLNIKIVYPKYLKIVEHCTRYLCLLGALRDSAVMKHFPTETKHLVGYVSSLRKQAAELFAAPNFAALHPSDHSQPGGLSVDYQAITEAENNAFAEVYKAIKHSNLVNTVVVTCKNLIPHKKALQASTTLHDRFLVRSAGLSFAPLPGLPAVNFKQIYISDRLSPQDRQFVLITLHKMFTISHDVYEAMTLPDIDVDEFVQVIIGSLDEVKKRIPRCEEAFDKIRDSVDLLKGNFKGYYRDYVASNNPTIIMENFVLDVSRATKSSPKVTAQFRRIIGHYRKLAAQQAHHPQMQSLFAQVDKNFQELEQRSRKADNASESEGSDTSTDDTSGSAAEDDEKAAYGTAPTRSKDTGADMAKEERDAARRREKN